MDKDYDVLFRIMILGDTGVGKTCLLHRFCDEEFRYNHVCTIGKTAYYWIYVVFNYVNIFPYANSRALYTERDMKNIAFNY